MGVVINPKMDAILTTLGKIKDDIKGLGFAAKGSGDIVSFPDSIGGFNVNRIVADLEPIQLGSGDPSPSNIRPILGHSEVETTGTGKNLLPATLDVIKSKNTSGTWNGNSYTISGVTFSIVTNAAGEITNINVSGTATANAFLNLYTTMQSVLKIGERYTITGCPSGGGQTRYYVTLRHHGFDVGSGNTITFNGGAGDISCYMGVTNGYAISGTLSFTPMIRLASDTDATYAPYIGTSVLTEIGINQWDEEWELGTIDSNGNEAASTTAIRNKGYIPATPGADYCMVMGEAVSHNIFFYDASKTFISKINVNPSIYSFTTPANGAFVRFNIGSNYGTSYKNDISINFPSRFTDYYPYTGLGQVYGGTLDVTSGKLTVTMGIVDMGAQTWTKNTSWGYFSTIPNAKLFEANKIGNAVCSVYPAGAGKGAVDSGKFTIYGGVTNNFRVGDLSYTDAAAFTAAVTGQQLVYELATPIVYQLEPQGVQTVLGQNNIYTDSGEVNVWYVAGLS